MILNRKSLTITDSSNRKGNRMKKFMLIAMLTAIFVPANSFGEEHEKRPVRPAANREQQMRVQHMELELEEREIELNFHREMKELELQQRRNELQGRKHHNLKRGKCPGLLLVCLIVHILTAVWVYKDIQQRKTGSGVWIVIALITGLLGTLVYAVVRIGDIRQANSG